MAREPEKDSSGLVLMLEVPETVVVGQSALATVRVENRGGAPITVSSRLNLDEGDLRLVVTDPAGGTKKVSGAGGQPDTALRQVELPPGGQLVGVLNLLETSVGLTFPETGAYTLRAEYDPSPRIETLRSEPVKVTARLPNSETEKGVAELLQDVALRRALVLVEPDAADVLRDLAARYAETLDGKLAGLILAEAGSSSDEPKSKDLFESGEPLATAYNIAALSTPFSSTGKRLAERFKSYLTSLDQGAGRRRPVEKKGTEAALNIATGMPIQTSSRT